MQSEAHAKSLTLNNGVTMPTFGLGTYGMKDSEVMAKSFLELGYEMFDTASFYKNEEVVGEAIKEVLKSKSRSDIFVISKVWWDEVEDVEAACKRSLAKLGIE